jgi:hypothetical protein
MLITFINQVKSQDNMKNYSVLQKIVVTTPKEEEISFEVLENETVSKILDKFEYEVLSSPILDKINRPKYLLENGQVLHIRYFSGKTFCFKSVDDLLKCYDPNMYLSFGVNPEDYNTYFILKPSMVSYQFQHFNYFIDTTYQNYVTSSGHQGYEVYKSNKGRFMYLDKPHLNSGYWFASQETFEKFLVNFYKVSEEQMKEDEVQKKIYLKEKKLINVLKLSEDKATTYLNDKEREITDFASYDATLEYNKVFKLNSGKILFLYDADIYLLFDNEKEFRISNIIQCEDMEIDDPFSKKKDRDLFLKNTHSANINLINILNLDKSFLDFSFKSLELLDDTINTFFMNQSLKKDVLVSLIAYFGEVIMKAEKSGKWQFIQIDSFFVPVISFESGRIVEFVSWIWEELDNQEYNYKSCISCIYPSLFMGLKLDK